MPELAGAVDTAAHLDPHFPEISFDLISTDFIAGFVPLHVLTPKGCRRLEDGGYWSYLRATKGAYPNLQAKANSKILRWLLRAPPFDINAAVPCPTGRQEGL